MPPAPAKSRPPRVALDGRYIRLEPMGERHAADLYAASSTADIDERFRYLYDLPPADLDDMRRWIAANARLDDPMFYAVIDRRDGRAVGRQALMSIVPDHGTIEIGSIYWGPAMARTRLATEALYLFARHSFEDLGYRRFEWKCNALNASSQAAARRFGFAYEGLFRQHRIVKGLNRDTAWFSMLDDEWPSRKAEFERWLDPANFDETGKQKSPLRFA